MIFSYRSPHLILRIQTQGHRLLIPAVKSLDAVLPSWQAIAGIVLSEFDRSTAKTRLVTVTPQGDAAELAGGIRRRLLCKRSSNRKTRLVTVTSQAEGGG